jgi:hypothetical protein
VVEETLRWQAPIAYLPLRYAVERVGPDHLQRLVVDGQPSTVSLFTKAALTAGALVDAGFRWCVTLR